MIPRPWSKAQELKPVRGSSVEDKGSSNKESGFISNNIEKDMSLFHNDCTTTTGKSKICIACTKLKDAIWHEKNKERNRANKYRRIYVLP
jgi:hypothetical protein